MSKKLSRRELLGLGAGVALGGVTVVREVLAQATPPLPAQPAAPTLPAATATSSPALPVRVLGQTGQKVTVFGLGGASAKTPLSNGPHEAAVEIVARALDLGVNYFDTATTYGNGKSERAMGEVAKTRRKEMLIASKTDLRDYDGAMRELEESLKRLQTDHLDVWQMHRASLPDRDTQPFFGTNGAMKALQKAKDEKMVRFVGVSGHHRSDVLADWLQRYPFDTLLASINAADVHQDDSFIKRLLPVATQKKVGVVAMKVPAYGRLLNRNAGVTMSDAMHYSLSQPGVACCIIACDSIAQLEENVAVARSISGPMEASAQTALEAKTAAYWQRASFYRQWT
jgi:aryl-alcohol dehydrogenase-like predicted oxidoreductase